MNCMTYAGSGLLANVAHNPAAQQSRVDGLVRRVVENREELGMRKELLDELMDARLQFSLRDCERVEAVGRRIDAEHAVLLCLLTDCAAVLRTIDPDDSDEAEKLADLLSAIDRAIEPSRHQGALL